VASDSIRLAATAADVVEIPDESFADFVFISGLLNVCFFLISSAATARCAGVAPPAPLAAALASEATGFSVALTGFPGDA
jgi:hypothetical protein